MKKASKDTMGILTSGAMMGIGADVGAKLGGTAGTHLGSAMSEMSGQLPTIGAIAGGGMVVRSLDKMYPKKKLKL